MITDPDETNLPAADLAELVRHSQSGPRTVLSAQCGSIACGSGVSWNSRRLLAASRNLFNCKQSRQRRQLYRLNTVPALSALPSIHFAGQGI